jgi:hypothetical protein
MWYEVVHATYNDVHHTTYNVYTSRPVQCFKYTDQICIKYIVYQSNTHSSNTYQIYSVFSVCNVYTSRPVQCFKYTDQICVKYIVYSVYQTSYTEQGALIFDTLNIYICIFDTYLIFVYLIYI